MIASSSNVDAVLDNRQALEGAGSIAIIPNGSGLGASLAFHNDATGIVNATGSNALVFLTHDIAPGLVTNDGLIANPHDLIELDKPSTHLLPRDARQKGKEGLDQADRRS